ncbi:AraC family transcriptional regulator [Chitinibacter tainanensis]|uniref:AraC family transcriptional regulator n=1 Tax=Chitinibacter tainanensis TaxID=230667 RepID=UPI0004157F48|nr:AraC family transcriptional regulator [Chitinibacter tainanensis]
MKKAATVQDYARRLQRAVGLIWQHPQQSYSLEQLAAAAHFSPYHFHRIYREMMGESVGATQQRLRLLQAARSLGQTPAQQLERLARRSGYGSSAAFVRAFAASYGHTPGAYRRMRLQVLQRHLQQEPSMYPIRLHTQTSPLPLALCPHLGPYIQIGEAFAKLQLHKTSLPVSLPLRWFGLYFDDPQSVAPEQLRSAAALTVNADAPLPAGIEAFALPAGRYAVLEHIGPYSELEQAYQWLYGVWLPASGEQPGNVPVIEQYLNLPIDTPPTELRTEIWVALQ